MFRPIDENVKRNFQYLKEYLSSPDQVTRNNEIPIMNASIGLLDAIIQGKLFICADEPEPEPLDPPAEESEAAPNETE